MRVEVWSLLPLRKRLRRANVPKAPGAAEAEVVRLRHLSSVTLESVRYCPSRERATIGQGLWFDGERAAGPVCVLRAAMRYRSTVGV